MYHVESGLSLPKRFSQSGRDSFTTLRDSAKYKKPNSRVTKTNEVSKNEWSVYWRTILFCNGKSQLVNRECATWNLKIQVTGYLKLIQLHGIYKK